MSNLLLPQTARHAEATAATGRRSVSRQLWADALHDPAEQFLSRNGKKIRAALVTESFRAAGGVGELPPAISEAIELLHAGSLIIDDIEDGSAQRRGKPTLHREIGVPLALNTGNWMYFRALERLSEAPISGAIRQRMLGQTLRTVRRCHEGQALDLSAAVDSLAPQEVFSTARVISRLKTGGLTGLAAWLGAATAGGDRITRQALGRFGMNVGVCLQMHNDLDELKQFIGGQPRCDDLRNARVTWPWAWASQEMSATEFFLFSKRLRRSLNDSDALRWIAGRLLDLVGDRGQTQLRNRLRRGLTLLGEHVDSTQAMRSALSKLCQTGDESCR